MVLLLKIIILTIILYLFSYLYTKYKHPFWFKQPVSHYFSLQTNNGIITDKVMLPHKIHNNYDVKFIDISNKKIIKEMTKLLNKNYAISDKYNYNFTPEYIYWMLSTPCKLYDKDILIGFICGRPIEISIYNKKINSFYVDLLCIEKEYRKKKLAEVLISNMAYYGSLEKYKTFIFKKEGFPLPFKFISFYQNYYIVTDNIKNIKFNRNLINISGNNYLQKRTFNYIKKMQKYSLYINYTFEEFCHFFINKYTYTYVISIDGDIKGIFSLHNSHITLEKNKKSIELLLFINEEEDKDQEYLDSIIYICKKKGFNCLTLINNCENNRLLHRYNFERASLCFIHMYNYNNLVPILPKYNGLVIP